MSDLKKRLRVFSEWLKEVDISIDPKYQGKGFGEAQIKEILKRLKHQEIKKAFAKIKKQHYKNYFLYAYNKDKLILPKKSTRKRKDKKYKD